MVGHRIRIVGNDCLTLFGKVKQLFTSFVCLLAAKVLMLSIEVSDDYPMLEALGH